MSSYSTPTWGYRIFQDNSINFYHILLPKISLETLSSTLPSETSIQSEQDGSITVFLPNPADAKQTVEKIQSFFEGKTQEFLATTKYYYKIEPNIRQMLKTWSLAFEGCLAILLTSDDELKNIKGKHWEFLNSRIGGLTIDSFTLLLNDTYPQIIHPVSLQNLQIRQKIEQKAAEYIRKMIKRIGEAQPGFEGIAMLTFVQYKTGVSPEEITQIINNKSFHIKFPLNSPLLTG